jgi:glutathione S-transferase
MRRDWIESDVLDALRPVENIQPHNPALQVPTLYDDDKFLWDSSLIIQYLFEIHKNKSPTSDGPPLFSTMTRSDCHWADLLILTTITTLADSIVNYRLMKFGGSDTPNSYLDRQLVRVSSCLDWLEARCSDEEFWPGTFLIMGISLMCPHDPWRSQKCF